MTNGVKMVSRFVEPGIFFFASKSLDWLERLNLAGCKARVPTAKRGFAKNGPCIHMLGGSAAKAGRRQAVCLER